MPFCHWHATGKRPLPPSYPKQISTLGDHIRKRRLDLGLLQKEAAALIGVSLATLENWEEQRRHPALPGIPLIVRFLGYNPLPAAQTIAGKLIRYRKSLGITQRTLAATIGIDPSTLARWEQGERNPSGLYRVLVEKILKSE